jgi:hypothetical protein
MGTSIDRFARRRQPFWVSGKHKLAGSSQLPASISSTGEHRADRRQLTAMFCDLVGSTVLSARFRRKMPKPPPGCASCVSSARRPAARARPKLVPRTLPSTQCRNRRS